MLVIDNYIKDKKIFEKFRDNNFINSTKKGYII